jgi:CRP/FNR family transcriptional regulator, cyclic AMP receptor protein
MAEPDGLAATLASVDLFAGLPAKVLSQLALYGKPQSFSAGERVTIEGAAVGGWAPFSQTGVFFHVVLEGSGEVRKHGAAVALVGPGEYFGELSLIDGGPRTADVVAGPDGLSSLAFDKWTFAELLEEHPEIAVPMLRVMTARLRRCEAALHGEE